jgi:hypothetical protein
MKCSKPPSGGEVADYQDSLAAPARRQVAEKPADPSGGLPPAFTLGVSPVEMIAPGGAHLLGRPAGVLSVVAFAQSPVVQDRNRRSVQCDRRRLRRPRQVGAEDSREPVRAPALPKSTACVRPSSDNSLADQPAARPSSLSTLVE